MSLDWRNDHIPGQNWQRIGKHGRLHHSVGKTDIYGMFLLLLLGNLIINADRFGCVFVFRLANVQVVVDHQVAERNVLFEFMTVQLIFNLVPKVVRNYSLVLHTSK